MAIDPITGGLASGALGIAGSVVTGLIQNDAQNKAIKATTAAADKAAAIAEQNYNESMRRNTGYENIGNYGLEAIMSGMTGQKRTAVDTKYEVMPQQEAKKYQQQKLLDRAAEVHHESMLKRIGEGKDNKYSLSVKKDMANGMSLAEAVRRADPKNYARIEKGVSAYITNPNAPIKVGQAYISSDPKFKEIADTASQTNMYRNRDTGEVTTKAPQTQINEQPFETPTGAPGTDGFEGGAIPQYKEYDYQRQTNPEYQGFGYKDPTYKDTTLSGYKSAGFDRPEFQDTTLTQFNPSEFKDGAVTQYKGLTKEDFDREVTNRDIQQDPAFQWKQDKLNREMNRQMASRGKFFNPRVTEAALGEANNRLLSDEYAQGYQRNLSRFGAIQDMTQRQYEGDLTEYGLSRQQEIDKYGRELTANERQRQYELDQINQNTNNYNRDYAAETDKYQRGITDYNTTRQSELDQIGYNDAAYNRDVNVQDKAYQRDLTGYGMKVDAYGRAVGAEDSAYQRALDTYKAKLGTYGLETEAGTRRYQRLLDLTKIGQGAANTAGVYGQNNTSAQTNIATTLGNNLATAETNKGNNTAGMWGGIAAAIPTAANVGMNISRMNNPNTYNDGYVRGSGDN